MSELNINDKIVHPVHGVGIIKKITQKTIGEKTHLYYRVKTNKLIYWLPVGDSQIDRVRPICGSATFTSVLTAVRAKPVKLSDNFRTRLKYINEQIERNALSVKAKLIRDLHCRNEIRRLHVNEFQIYEKLKNQFINEWCLSAGIDRAEAEVRLEEALDESASKIN
jgi:CarD family transcriptional regulator